MVSQDEDLDFGLEEAPKPVKKAAKSASPPQKKASATTKAKPVVVASAENSDEEKPNPFVTSTEEEDPFAEPRPTSPVTSKPKTKLAKVRGKLEFLIFIAF